MLSKEVFKNCFLSANVCKGYSPKKETLPIVYEAVCDMFTDEEFVAITKQIVAEPYEAYGRAHIDIGEWTKRKVAKKDSEMNEELNAFIDKVSEYLCWSYVPSIIKKDFVKSLTPSEQRALNALGGIDSIRASVFIGGEYDPDKAYWKTQDLRKAFKENYQPPETLIEEEPNQEMIDKIRKLGFF